MTGLTDRSFFLMAVVLYGLSTLYGVFVWRRGFRQDDRVCLLILLAGLACHITSMALRGVSFARCPVSNLFEATMFVGWTVGMASLLFALVPRFSFLAVVASPVLFGLGVFGLMPSLDQGGPEPQFWKGMSSLHASVTLLAYGALGLAALAATMYLAQQHDLKHHKLRAFSSFLPSIQRLERVTWWLLAGGFALLTVGIALGAGWLRHEKGTAFVADPKIIWSAAVWLGYAVLLVMRWRGRQGGRRFAWGVVATFAFVMLTFWGTNLLSPIHNP